MKIFTRSFFPTLFALLGIFAAALLARTIGIPSKNVLFLFDNGRDLLFVKKLVVDHKLLLIGPSSGGLQGYFHGVFWYYMLAIPFSLGNGNPIIMTLFMAIMSTVSVIVVFFILKKIGNTYAAVMGIIIFAFADFSIQTSKYIWNPYPIVWLMPLYFFSLFQFVQRKKYALPLLFFLTSLCIHFEAIYGITLLPTLVIVTIAYFLRKGQMKEKIPSLILSIGLFIIPILPTLLFDLRHQFLIIKTLAGSFTTGGANITHGSLERITPLTQRLLLRGSDLFQYTINAITAILALNVLLSLTIPLSLTFAIREKKKETIAFLLLVLFTLLIPFFIFLNLKYAVWSYYWIGSTPLYAMLLSYCMGTIVPASKQKKITVIFFVFTVCFIVLYQPWTYIPLWLKGNLNQGAGTLSTQEIIVETIFKESKGQPFSVYVQTPPVYDYIYRYLFWWEGYTKFHRYPIDAKQHLTFVIREHSSSDPEGKFFKKNTLHLTTNPIKSLQFPGAVVEKFIEDNPLPVDPNYFPQL